MVQQDEQTQQALSYIRYQAAKSLSDLRALIERTAADCDRSLEGVSEAQATFRYDPEEWCITEVLRHLVPAVEPINQRIAHLAAGQSFPVQGQPGSLGYEGITFAEMKEKMDRAWKECLGVIDSLPGAPNAEAREPHPMLGPFNYREWIAFQRIHALDHIQQIEKVKAAPGYPQS